MSVTSANIDDLATFIDGSSSREGRLNESLRTATTKSSSVSANSSFQHPSTPSLSALSTLMAAWRENASFVEVIRDELVEANQFDGNGNAVVANTTVAAALQERGLDAPPDLVEVDAIQMYGQPPYSGWVDDPISLANGNFLLRDGDLQLFGFAAALSVVRAYNSRDDHRGVFGRGWTSILDVALAVEERSVTFRGPDGGGAVFRRLDDSTWTRDRRRDLTLADHDGGWVVQQGHDRTWHFDAEGTLSGFTAVGADVLVERRSTSVHLHDRTSDRSVTYHLDASGRRVESARTSDGRTATYDWGADDQVVAVRRPCGDVTYEHDERGFLTAVVDADGIVVCRNTYDDDGRVLTQSENHGRETRYEYRHDGVATVTASDGAPPNVMVHDRRGRMTAMIDGLGNTMRVAYDDNDEVVQVVDRAGSVTRFSYDDRGNVVERIDPDDLTHRFEWDDADRLVAETDRAGSTTRYHYEGDGRDATLVVQPDGTEVHLTYDDRGLVTSVVDADGVSAHVEWTRDGLVAALIDGLGGRVELAYDAAGRTVGTRSPEGTTVAAQIDEAGRLQVLHTADGERQFEYTAAGRMVAGTRETGTQWRVDLDASGEVAAVSDTEGHLIGYERSTTGRVTATVAGDGARARYEIDPLGRYTATIDPAGNRTEVEFDAAGRQVGFTDPRGLSWSRQVDFRGRTTRKVDPDGTTTERTYHPNGQLASETDAAGNRWTYDVDALGRIVAATDPTGSVTTYRYTPGGRLAEIISPLGRTVRREYDAAGRLARIVEPDGSVVEVDRRADGSIAEVTRDGVVTSFDYDDAGRSSAIVGPWGTLEAESAAGELAAMSVSGATAARFEHDPRGLLQRVTDPAGVITEFVHDQAGRLIAHTTGGATTELAWDEAGRLASIRDPYGNVTAFGRDPRGVIDHILRPDGTSTTRTFGPDGRLSTANDGSGQELVTVERDINGSVVGATAGDATLGVTRDVLGRTTEVATTAGTVHYLWDADGYLTRRTDSSGHGIDLERTDGGALTGFVLPDGRRVGLPDEPNLGRDEHGRIVGDEHGRRYAYDLAGRLSEVTVDGLTTTYGYDDLGLLSTERTGDVVRNYRYGRAGELTSVAAGDGSTEATYEYDATGRRVRERHADGSEVAYHWDALGRLVRVVRTDADGRRTENHIEQDPIGRPMRIDGTPILWDRGATGTLLGIGEERYLRWGRQVLVATDPHSSWDRRVVDDPWGHDGGTGARLGYRGELALDHLLFLGSRVYDTRTRCFLSRDPLPSVPGARVYAGVYSYAWCDPVNYVDPSGLRPLSDDEYDAWLEANTKGWFRDPKNWARLAIAAGSVALTVVATATLGPAGTLLAAGAIGALSAGANTALDGGDWGDILKSATIGGLTSMATMGLSRYIPANLTSTLPRTVATTAAVEYPAAITAEAADSFIYGDRTMNWDNALLAGTTGTVSGVVTSRMPTRTGDNTTSGPPDLDTPGPSTVAPDGGIEIDNPSPSTVGPDTAPSSVVPDATRTTIDVSNASAAELQSIDGIGPVLSERIVEYRMANPNASVDELINVNGIGPERLSAIKSAAGA